MTVAEPGVVTDVVVVGAGIVGLAAAWQLVRERPGTRVTVVDKEPVVGAHQSSHNSGVLHAGVYYEPGSLKALLCREGKALVEEYARERDIPFESNGKLIVAVDDTELDRLAALEERALRNGVPGLRRVGPGEIREIEPHATGVAALHSPGTGVIDFAEVTRRLAADLEAVGVHIRTGSTVREIVDRGGAAIVVTDKTTIRARVVLCCGGLQADRLARLTHPELRTRIVPFRGTFRVLTGEAAGWVQGNIYPVPDPRFTFLGVHLTRRIDGTTWMGPTAFLSLAREGYRRWKLSGRDVGSVVSFGGFWAFARKNIATAITEARREFDPRRLLGEAARYVPGLEARHIGGAPIGVRAQAMDPDGTLVEDFRIVDSRSVIHVINAPSPAATASLAIGRRLATMVTDRLASLP